MSLPDPEAGSYGYRTSEGGWSCVDVSGCTPKYSPTPYHFGVLDQLEKLPPGWLHVTRHGFAPKDACYKATCGNATVWVGREDQRGLTDFTLVMLDIGTTDPASVAATRRTVSVELSSKRTDGQAALYEGEEYVASTEDFVTGDKITETWAACQDKCAEAIQITRPGDFKHPVRLPVVLQRTISEFKKDLQRSEILNKLEQVAQLDNALDELSQKLGPEVAQTMQIPKFKSAAATARIHAENRQTSLAPSPPSAAEPVSPEAILPVFNRPSF